MQIPKTLPKDNPLLFAFIMIIDALKGNVQFRGKYSREMDKDLPCFEYAVNNWNLELGNDGGVPTGIQYQVLQVSAALWKHRPEKGVCNVLWTEFPNQAPLEHFPEIDMSFFYDFEDWRVQTFNELAAIVGALFDKQLPFWQPPFYFELVGNQISFVYAVDSTANKFYGVGASFQIKMPFGDCCLPLETDNLTLDYFKEIGFIFNDF